MKRESTFNRATMLPPHFMQMSKHGDYIPSGPMRAHLCGVKKHPTARDGAVGIVSPPILSADFDVDGNVIRLESEHDIFIKEQP